MINVLYKMKVLIVCSCFVVLITANFGCNSRECLSDYFSGEILDFMRLVENNKLDQAQLMIQKGLVFDKVFVKTTPLLWFAERKNTKALLFLLKNGANPNLIIPRFSDKIRMEFGEMKVEVYANSAMHQIAFNNDTVTMKLFLEFGGDPCLFLNEVGVSTPANTAVTYGRKEMLMLFVDNGMDLNRQDLRKKTLLLRAIGSFQYEIALLLLEAGADYTLLDDQGKDAIDYLNIPKIRFLNREGELERLKVLEWIQSNPNPSAESQKSQAASADEMLPP